ncbi:MAG: 2-hydroxymuconate tautomerase [Micavibrio sp.]
MPIVQIHLIEGRTIDQKRALTQKVTEAIVESIGVPADAVKIILSDMARHDYAIAGTLHLDQKK